jgi:quercetin dioxygenase-like cupin family protein
MARAGEVLENRATGQRLVFRETSMETGGELLRVEAVYTTPTRSRPPVHYHPRQEERFEVLSGTLRAVVDGEERSYGTSGAFTVPPGTPHEMWSEEEGVRVDWQTRPALKTEWFFETVWGLARDGETDGRGRPGLLQAAVIAQAYADEFRLDGPPWPVQRAVFGVLAPVGGLLGYRAEYPYSHDERADGKRPRSAVSGEERDDRKRLRKRQRDVTEEGDPAA